VSLGLRDREVTAVIGPSGCGKSTFLRCLNRLHETVPLARAEGQVLLDGRDVRRIPRAVLARRFAVVPQETQLAFEYTALEIALMGRYPHLRAFEIEGPDDLESALNGSSVHFVNVSDLNAHIWQQR